MANAQLKSEVWAEGILPAHAHAASPEHSSQDLRSPPLAQPKREEKSHSSTSTTEDALRFSVLMPYKKDEFECIEPIKQNFTAALAEAASTAKTSTADVCAKALELLGTANCSEPCLRVPACLYVALRRRRIAP